jgi:hypothetical protein
MNLKKNIVTLIMVLTLVSLAVYVQGCKKAPTEVSNSKSNSIALCVKCGQIKADALCCKPDQPKCGSCSLAKGSPGCCKIDKDSATAAICSHCGQIKGSELCCKPDQPKCSKCDLVKGSPGCCKI